MLFKYVLGPELRHSKLGEVAASCWEVAGVQQQWILLHRGNTPAIYPISQWLTERGGLYSDGAKGGEVADRQRDKGRLSEKSEREPAWKMADSFLVQEGGSHWSEGDTVPFPAPPGADTSRLRKVILLFPLSQLTACHSPISSLTPSVSGGLYPFRTFVGIDRDKPSYPVTLSTNVTHNYSDLKSLNVSLHPWFRKQKKKKLGWDETD